MDISISLPPELIDLLEAKVASGRYTSTSDVVREALWLLERIDAQQSDDIAALRRAVLQGIESGDAGPVDFEEMRAAAQRELAERRKT